MTRWYYGQRSPGGRWTRNASDQEPAVKDFDGKRTLRAVTLVPAGHQHLTLGQMAAIYSPDRHLNLQPRPLDAVSLLPATDPILTPLDHGRLLRAATHWAGGFSNEFGPIVAARAGSLLLVQAEGGAITLSGRTTAGLPVSICLAQGEAGQELHLLHTEAITHEGIAAIRTTEI